MEAVTAAAPGCDSEPRASPNPAVRADSELVDGFRNGDESCFDELVRRYQQRIHALLYRFVRNSDDAYELAQDVFIRAYRALPGFKGKSRFYTWLYRIAVNTAFNFLRARRRNREKLSFDSPADEPALQDIAGPSDPQADFRQTRLREAIAAAVDELPERQRAVFVMRQYEGLANADIARVLGCAEGTVKAQYFFALRKLQQRLQDWR